MRELPIHAAITDPDFQQLVDFVAAEMRRLQVPGVAVGVIYDGREFMAGLGVTSVENPLPVTTSTLFQIGSTTKTFTGTLIMRLVEQGKIDLDAPVISKLPSFTLRDKVAEATVTTRHLLTHMGGWVGDFFEETGSGDDALARYVADMAELEQVVPAGTYWSYNNAGFAVAGLVAEAVTGKTYEAALQELVLDPLQLDETFFFANDVISRRFAVGHRVDAAQGPVVERPWALTRSAHPVGGLSSSVRDQMRYARFHIGDGRTASGEPLLRPETMADMQRPHLRANLDRQMGLTWLLRTVDGVMTVAHGGATNGQLSAFLLVPERGFAITVLTNAEEGSMLNDSVVSWALEHYLGLSAGAPEPAAAHKPDNLTPFLGEYDAALDKLTLYLVGDELMAQMTPKGGFPDKHSPPGPTPPPSRLRFYEPDRVIALDPPMIHTRAEFLRDDEGRIAWLRTSRLHRKR